MIVNIMMDWLAGLKTADGAVTTKVAEVRVLECGVTGFEMEFDHRRKGPPVVIKLEAHDELPPAFEDPMEWAKALANQIRVRIEDPLVTAMHYGASPARAAIDQMTIIRVWINGVGDTPMKQLLDEAPLMAARLDAAMETVRAAYERDES